MYCIRFYNISKEYAITNKILSLIIITFLILPFIIIFTEQYTNLPIRAYRPKCFVETNTGHPCPTCGLTRSILLLYRGHFQESMKQYAHGYLFVLILSIQLFLRAIPILSHQTCIPYLDITQMICFGMLWLLIIR